MSAKYLSPARLIALTLGGLFLQIANRHLTSNPVVRSHGLKRGIGWKLQPVLTGNVDGAWVEIQSRLTTVLRGQGLILHKKPRDDAFQPPRRSRSAKTTAPRAR